MNGVERKMGGENGDDLEKNDAEKSS